MTTRTPSILLLLLSILSFPSLSVAQFSLTEGISDLAAQLQEGLPPKQRLAIVPFRDLSGRQSVLGAFIAEDVSTALIRSHKAELVERTMLDNVLQEMKLASEGVIDDRNAKRLGKLTGATAVATGSITEFGSFVAINARIIDTESGAALSAGSVKIRIDDDLRRVLSTKGIASAERDSAPSESTRTPDGLREAIPPQRSGSIEATILGLSRSGTKLIALVEFRNLATNSISLWRKPDEVASYGYPCNSTAMLMDEIGTEYSCTESSIPSGYHFATISASGQLAARFVFETRPGVSIGQRFSIQFLGQVSTGEKGSYGLGVRSFSFLFSDMTRD